MSSDSIIRSLLEVRLFDLKPNLPTSWDNVSFTPPNSIHQRAYVLPAPTDNPSYGDNLRRESGIFQVSICVPIGNGSSEALMRASVIKEWFHRGLSMEGDGLIVKIFKSPFSAPGMRDGTFYVVPVSIPYQCDVIP